MLELLLEELLIYLELSDLDTKVTGFFHATR